MKANVDTTSDLRSDVHIPVAGERLSAWWYPASGSDASARPVVVMGHGFGGIKHMRLWAYAARFAAAGLNVLVFDYRMFGDSSGTPRGLVDVGCQLEDWNAAIAYVRSRADVNQDKIAVWGSSFAGGLVTMVAAHDPGIAAVVAQVPLADGSAGTGTMTIQHRLSLFKEALIDVMSAKLGRPARTIRTAGAPGDLKAVLTSPGSIAAIDEMVPKDAPFSNEICARIILQMNSYKPFKEARRVQCPFLVQVADHDELAPPGIAAQMAADAPQGILKAYPGDHFTLYTGDAFEKTVIDQINFLANVLQS